jgi:hypothetical protein
MATEIDVRFHARDRSDVRTCSPAERCPPPLLRRELTDVLIIAVFALAVSVGVGSWISAQKGRDPMEGSVLGCLLALHGLNLRGGATA